MSQKFYPGDTVRFIGGKAYAKHCLHIGDERVVAAQRPASDGPYSGYVIIVGEYRNGDPPISGLPPEYFELVRRASQEGEARTNDPDTSKAAAKPKRLSLKARIDQLFCLGYKATGHEVSEALNAKLNSVTPRFAELTKAGVLKDTGERRDGQIVWARA